MKTYTFEGKIIYKGPVSEPTESFKVQEVVLSNQDGPYTNLAKFQFSNENIEKLSKHSLNSKVEIEFVVQCKKVESKEDAGEFNYYNNLNAFEIKAI